MDIFYKQLQFNNSNNINQAPDVDLTFAMDTELTRQYSSPTPVSTSTIALYRQFRQPTIGSHGPTQFGNLPESNDLLAIKANLEGLLTSAETRHRRLRRDLNHLEKNVKIHDNGGLVDHQSKKGSSSGKNMGAILEQIRVKQERSLGELSNFDGNGVRMNLETRPISMASTRDIKYILTFLQ
ncbi:hypothetical protein CLU79DRAFT_719780 [Phycomyces nitens]|nr:hypothetical protein CLU79DRAFT_719780 [Phycomyces nitens]